MRSPIRISPSLRDSKPATILRVVVFPHPDGPTKTRNSPSAISTLTFFTASVLPNALLSLLRVTEAIIAFLFDCPGGNAADKPTSNNEKQDENRQG